jgi:hypothetical protein
LSPTRPLFCLQGLLILQGFLTLQGFLILQSLRSLQGLLFLQAVSSPPPEKAKALSPAFALAAALSLLVPFPLAAQETGGLGPAIFQGQPTLTPEEMPAALEMLRAAASESAADADYAPVALERETALPRLVCYMSRFLTGAAMPKPSERPAGKIPRMARTPLAVPSCSELEIMRGTQGQLNDTLESCGSLHPSGPAPQQPLPSQKQ